MSVFGIWPSEALLATLNEEPIQERRYTLICKKESRLGTAAAMAMSILGVKYRVDFEQTDDDKPALNLNVPNDTVIVHNEEILTFLVKNHDQHHKISYEEGSLMASKVQTRYEQVKQDIKNLGDDAGAFCALSYGLVWSREQWVVGRKVTLPDLVLLPYVYALHRRLKAPTLPRVDDWLDRMVKKPAVRNGMVRAGWELGGTDEEFEMMFEGWSPLVQRHEADQGMRSLGDQFFAGHGRSGSNN
ncbi:hypothetical protein ASPCAL10016 [Aspergillus calidoustus]|uniref:GST C-terminal domain-containing protein n=1 Tax=Aspergillus calidoustus TaxID=454130 RepID=A0A0U5CBP3_ASPCI|nr:hypothetical protein ASPCAL10016 [Aspergillus calidoustus]